MDDRPPDSWFAWRRRWERMHEWIRLAEVVCIAVFAVLVLLDLFLPV